MHFDIRPKPLILVILDGWGAGEGSGGNAAAIAKTPNLDCLMTEFPHTLISAAGYDVGLPDGQMGNSEVGHLNLGAGRIVYQDYTRISKAIEDASFFNNPVLTKLIIKTKKRKSTLHLMGLVSDGGVHSHQSHIYALLELAKRNSLNNVLIHAFLDGRDTPPDSGIEYIKQLEEFIVNIGIGRIATVSGRYYAMDRDKRWERTKLAYDALVYGQGEIAQSAEEAILNSYNQGIYDEFVKPTVIKKQTSDIGNRTSENKTSDIGHRSSVIENNDSIIFFNFRPDRARQLTYAFVNRDFKNFNRSPNPPKVDYVSFTEYDEELDVPVAFQSESLTNILTDVLSEHGLRQLRIAETEKYAHVTYFFNGGDEKKRPFEDWVLINSPKVATYDLKPEMSASEVTFEVIKKIEINKYDVIIMNYANPDMVGHTGVMEAAVEAAEVVDSCLGQVVEAVEKAGGELIVTSDHGNLEKMTEPDNGSPVTAHTSNKVPLIYVSNRPVKLRKDGSLADVAPTMLDILNIPKPIEMTGKSLIQKP